ncbi:rhodanese-like domain-containing protein [Gilvimarinus sp. SDUM040013]|uniref:Rhodanese-like domain-containing protein n=1 Tax=Gilvimarinus gilvus TaxID=3058038 RepID=A0ABU4RWW4_9GAMM|nr:rhodanese-like domain-containing protein [Gilvimarinus sp. SDUM040013]MDO3385713.1 rhodanese-like domain-containing protein [Gilvimarinus sp. SDUM040013]MDX6849352.1 rhodanese-like domain-containing protein [Gilvimarinus sp. SDUM040013]
MKQWLRLLGCCSVLWFSGLVAAHGGDTVWIDVRTAQEYDEGHLKEAINIPHDQITAAISEVEADTATEIVLYCRSGRRAELAKQALNELGYSNVVNARDQDGAEALYHERSEHAH